MLDPRILIGGGLLAFVAGFAGAWQVQGWRCEARVADIQASLQAQKDALQDALNERAAEFEQDRATITENARKDRETVKVIYHDREVPADCALPADAARLLDQAVARANLVTGQSGKPLSSDSPAD